MFASIFKKFKKPEGVKPMAKSDVQEKLSELRCYAANNGVSFNVSDDGKEYEIHRDSGSKTGKTSEKFDSIKKKIDALNA